MSSVRWCVLTVIIIENIVVNMSEIVFCNANGGSNPCRCSMDGLCTLNCIGQDKCNGFEFVLKCMAGYPCNINCDSDREDAACMNAIIDASMASDVNILCSDPTSCMNMRVKCGTGSCNIICLNSQFGGKQCDGLILNCGIDICTIECQPGFYGYTTCNNIDVNLNQQTKAFECIRPGINNKECNFIDKMVGPPFVNPTVSPSKKPTSTPTYQSSNGPTLNPTKSTINPTRNPTFAPTKYPTEYVTNDPTNIATLHPTDNPTNNPTVDPTNYPTIDRTNNPSYIPTNYPTNYPTKYPSMKPTLAPTNSPTKEATDIPTKTPTVIPTKEPTTKSPTSSPGTDGIVVYNIVHESSDSKLLWYLPVTAIIILCMIQIILFLVCYQRRRRKTTNDDLKETKGKKIAVHIFKNQFSPTILSKPYDEVSSIANNMNIIGDEEEDDGVTPRVTMTPQTPINQY